MNKSVSVLAKDYDGKKSKWKFLVGELKPRGRILTPFNIISFPIIVLTLVVLVIRFMKGLGPVTNLSQEVPWGVWKGFNVVTGVAFAGGAYVITFMVYILNMKKYHSIVRITVLNGFLAYSFYTIALVLELGRPWKIFNPLIGNNYGTSSVLFLVAWHFLLYIIAMLIEFSPAIAEWLGAKRARRILSNMTIGAVIIGITLSTLHQAGLGAIFLMAIDKIHPLWYNEFIPISFFVSSIFAGLSLVILLGSLSLKSFSGQHSEKHLGDHSSIMLGLSKVCTVSLFAYFSLQLIILVHGQHLDLLNTRMGYWFMLEMIGFVLIPMFVYFYGYRSNSILIINIAAIMTSIGVILNRMNVSIIAYNWNLPVRYIPTWMEVVVMVGIIFTQIWIFRWIINRMPVLRESPSWAKDSH